MTSRWPPQDPVLGSQAGAAADVPFDLRPAPPVGPGGLVAGKYRIDRVIGFGGMGIVCAATHVELGTPIAVKFVRPERATDDRAVARFLTEARAAAQLKSQFACRVIDCGRLPTGTPYIVMEYLLGADLRSVLSARGPLPIEDAISFALQACEALAEAHAKHIVHRDVKPENLFLTEGPDGAPIVKVLDFGISKQLGPMGASRALTEPTESMGSPFHMSPEQMIDPGSVDSRTDIWSLGVVLYELLTGQLPFSGESTPQVCANVMTTQPIAPNLHRAEVPEGLERVILRCLEKDRQRRFRDVAELSASLKEFGGSASSLAAARVERILGRTPGSSVPAVAQRASDPAPVELEEIPGRIPGLPRRGLWLRVLVALIVLAASGFAAYASLRPELAPEPLLVPSAPVAYAGVPSAQALPSGSSALNAPNVPSAIPKHRGPSEARRVSARRPSAVPEVKPPQHEPRVVEGAPAESTAEAIVYPETKPLPDLPPPE